MSPSHVTIRDVARQAGVSHQTVSRVINDSDRVLPETRAKVEAAITELGYRPNAMARSMARGRSGMLACIAPNLTDYTFASLINGAETAVREHGYFLLSTTAQDEDTFAQLIKELVSSNRVEGMLVINPYADKRYQHLPENFPTVFAGARPREDGINSVALDDETVGRIATQRLIELGHKQIGLITGPMGEDCTQDRCQGYKTALQAAGLKSAPELTIEGDWSVRSGYDALMHFAQIGQIPSAIFVQNDLMAVGAIRAARDMGINIPNELSIIGVDDIPMSAFTTPPLTTLRQDFQRIGRQAGQFLVDAITYPERPCQHALLPAQLIIRRSTNPYNPT